MKQMKMMQMNTESVEATMRAKILSSKNHLITSLYTLKILQMMQHQQELLTELL
jgi:hypothetical protein